MAIYDDLNELFLGNIPNDGTGDDLHTAFTKVKSNFEFLYNNSTAAVTGSNVGGTGSDVFKQKIGTNLEFRKIDGVGPLQITIVDDVLTVAFNPTSPVDFKGQSILNVDSISANSITGTLTGDITGNITGNVTGNLTGNVTGNVTGLIRAGGSEELNPFVNINDLDRTINTFDYGYLAPVYTNPIVYLLSEIGTDLGTFTSPSTFSIDAGTI